MVELMGVEMTPDVRGWEGPQRRVGSLLAMGVAGLAIAGALAAYYLMDMRGAALYWGLLGVVAVALVFEVLLHALPQRAAGAEPYVPSYQRDAEPVPVSAGPQPGPAASSARTLTLRCGDCGTVFDLTDTGERPLYHACPGCGAEGVLRDPAPAPAPAPAPEAFAPPAAPAAPAVKRLKLRCGGCKEVFSIEDTGERPLRRPCPYCARVGEVK